MIRLTNQDGFTLVELIIALALFSFMMVFVSMGFIHVIRIHESGVASRTTQQNNRLVMDAISKDVRQAGLAGSGGPVRLNYLCLRKGSQMLQYAVDTNSNLRVGTITAAPGTCPAPAFGASWRTLNDAKVAVTQFAVTTTPATQLGLGSVTVTLTMASRNNLDALDSTRTRCLPGPGSQFCAVTTISSGAALRGGDGI
jgi:prepilin-type N-terminal cleavage/methylation domain-containing protein